jgi:hypothetical protein
MRLNEQKTSVNILYYGEAKRGKTTALAGLARLGHVLYVDAESGLKSKPLAQHGIPVANIEPFRGVSFDKLYDLFLETLANLEKNQDYVAGVVLDSLTEIQKILLEQIANAEVNKAALANQIKDPYMYERSWWGKNTEQMRRLIRAYRDLPCHTGMSALQRRDQDDDLSVVYGPAVTPALQNDIVGYMDVVCYTTVVALNGVDWFIGAFRPMGKYITGDRFNMLPRVLNNPSFDRVISYIEGELTEENDEQQVAYLSAKTNLESNNVR